MWNPFKKKHEDEPSAQSAPEQAAKKEGKK